MRISDWSSDVCSSDLMADALSIRWAVHRPWYGPRWALRPLIAKLRGHREPSRFRLYVARKPGSFPRVRARVVGQGLEHARGSLGIFHQRPALSGPGPSLSQRRSEPRTSGKSYLRTF